MFAFSKSAKIPVLLMFSAHHEKQLVEYCPWKRTVSTFFDAFSL